MAVDDDGRNDSLKCNHRPDYYSNRIETNGVVLFKGVIMKHIEKRLEKYIRFDNGNPHLVEAVIRQIIQEGKTAHVIVEAVYETDKRGFKHRSG